MVSEKDILNLIKEAVLNIDKSATVILFGSHARGDAHLESDWDILILISKDRLSAKDKDKYFDAIYDVELKTDQAISVLIRPEKLWKTKYRITPLYENISKEGIII